MRRALYDLMYRIGAPWDGPPRPELVTLVERGVLMPAHLAPGRAIDLMVLRVYGHLFPSEQTAAHG